MVFVFICIDQDQTAGTTISNTLTFCNMEWVSVGTSVHWCLQIVADISDLPGEELQFNLCPESLLSF